MLKKTRSLEALDMAVKLLAKSNIDVGKSKKEFRHLNLFTATRIKPSPKKPYYGSSNTTNKLSVGMCKKESYGKVFDFFSRNHKIDKSVNTSIKKPDLVSEEIKKQAENVKLLVERLCQDHQRLKEENSQLRGRASIKNIFQINY